MVAHQQVDLLPLLGEPHQGRYNPIDKHPAMTVLRVAQITKDRQHIESLGIQIVKYLEAILVLFSVGQVQIAREYGPHFLLLG